MTEIKLTIILSDEQYAGLVAAAEHAPTPMDPATYLSELVIPNACDSYARQWNEATVEGVSNLLAVERDKVTMLDAELSSVERENEDLKARIAAHEDAVKLAEQIAA